MRYILSTLMVSVLAVLIACQSSAAPKSELIEKSQAKAPAEAAKDANQEDDAPRISLSDAKKFFDEADAVFIDTRSASSYENEHIKGAINIPISDFENKYESLPKDKRIIAYCS
jgi:predicted sulfurtransferase